MPATQRAKEAGVFSIVLGLIMIVGGLTGKLVFIGTNSGMLLALFGVFVLGRGIWRVKQQRGS